MLRQDGYPEGKPFSWLPMIPTVADVVCPNFEIVSVAQQQRAAVVISLNDVPADLPVDAIAQARLSGSAAQEQELCLELLRADGSGYRLRLPGIPAEGVRQLTHQTPFLYGLRDQRVALALPIPRFNGPVPARGLFR